MVRQFPTRSRPSEAAQSRFEREAKLLAALNHPNIAHVYGFEKTTLDSGATVHFHR